MKHKLKIDWASHEAAKYACENWHYSCCMPVGKVVKIGVWENDVFVGVVLFSRGANNNLLKPYNLNQDEGCELTRVALNKHLTPVSKILAISFNFLKKACPKLKLIVSYADKDNNHHGGIYQATNWIYEGLFGKDTIGAYIINGKKTHPKSIHAKGVKQNLQSIRHCLDKNAQIFYTKGKHKYLYVIDNSIKQDIMKLSKPYPKREKQAMTSVQLEQRQCDTDLHAPI